ncbi:GNAT family protein [Cryobacterium sp. PH31-AA6]|uniref:GNAT family N-acetyltransferase n=1 Tax=Cryobacterium sp. PH31-AA6 TaxID=3046205 RepID=UPI0024B8EEC1|nr:GNAT family protein [Cryobacterium sp. PH31-AA6]MDJ0325529.1 GNAT family protein [Cryobacterium sp. PH31-AA6]
MTIELRPWGESDAGHLLRAFRTSDDLATQVGDANLSTLDRCQEFIALQLAPSSQSVRNFAISVDGAAVGNVGIGNMEHRHDTGWVYYWVSAEARGQGLASRALASAARWAFDQRDLFRLELGHRLNNPASCNVALKAGFAPEGIERQKLKYEHQRYDVETHARLRSDPTPEIELFKTH